MLDAAHALIGASLAKLVPTPGLGIPLAIGLHFVGDIIPHWDFRTRHVVNRSKIKTIILSLSDASIGYLIGWQLFSNSVDPVYLLIMMFAAQLPDWLEAPYHIFDWNFPPFSSIKKLQSRWHNKLDLPWGLIIEVVVVIIVVWFSL